MSAARTCGFSDVVGYEASESLVRFGNEIIGSKVLIQHELDDIIRLMSETDREVVSLVGLLEHLRSPREALRALNNNSAVQYLFFSVPLFSRR